MPDMFLLVAARPGGDLVHYLVCEDADEGVPGAVATGMTVYNVRTGQLISSATVYCKASDLYG